jgi:hypothetical protein
MDKKIRTSSVSFSKTAGDYLAYLKDKKYISISRFVSCLIEQAAEADPEYQREGETMKVES